MYFSPPTKCFYEDVLSNILNTISSETPQPSFKLVLIKFEAVQSYQFKFPDILLVSSTAALGKIFFYEIKTTK